MTTSQQEADRPPAAATELSGSSETDRCARWVDSIIEGRCRDEAHKMFLFSKPQQPQHTTPPNRWYHLDRRRKRGRSRRRGFILIPTLLLLLVLDDTRRQVKASPSAQTPPFYEQPQPLVYLHETGSGEGALYTHLPMAVNFDQVSGNSASPSLITAKCWNNYETDNDCKQINVIAPPVGSDGNGANQLGNPNFPAMAADDDNSLITPVVIFESSSTLLPEQQQQQPNSGQPEQSPQPMVPPYFSSSSSSSTSRPSGGSDTVVLARHRTPPTANDVYAAPPAGATHLPSGGGRNPQSDRASGRFEQPATRPSTSVFVATPQPKRLGSTTTAGRRCRDENDADCDEPEDGDDADDTSGGTVKGGTEPDDADDSAAPDDDRPTAGTVAPQGSFGSAAKSGQQAEIGSGDGPEDDNEDDSDDDPDGNLETSGNSEPPAVQPTLHADVTSGYPQTESRPSNESPPDDSSESTSGRPGAEIEVVVHPTLPPTFPVTTTPHNRPTDFNRHHHHHLSSATSVDSVTPLSPMTSTTTMFTFTATMTNTETQQQSTTNMPDDTFTSKPIFPPSTTVATSSNNLSGGGSGGNQGTRTEADNGENSVTVSSTELDLATFRAIPMPPPQQPPVNHRHAASESHRAHSNQSGDSNSDNIDDRYRFTPPSGSAAPPGRFEHNPWMAMPVKPPLNQVEQLQQQQRQQQVRPRKDPPSGRLEPVVSRMQTEVLPTLLLYASIVILTVTALIFVLMAFAFYRRNNARKRALLAHKANIINGLPNPMVSMASMQQPGLLSTYAPGKVTTSVIKPPSDERILPADDDDNDNQSKDPFNGSLGENQPLNQPTSSWSTEDPTTSSGSQKTADSQQAGPVQTRIQYPNSLSDGRQNSSSLSDSQGSPEAALMTRQDGLPLVQQQQHQQQSHQQHQQQQPQQQQQQQQQQFEYQPANPNYQPPPLQQQQSVEYNFRHPLPHLQQGQQYPPPVIAPSVKKFISSRSVENINHDNGLFIDTYPPPQQTQPYVQAAQQSVPFYNGYPPTMEGLDDRLGPNAQYPINQFHHHHQQFNEPASPGRVAINPNATLGRRFQPGFGLNRNIYSEDSSSVITASPSLARTSSSLSFAFSSNNQQPPPIRAKPLIDPSGRMLNDYTRPSFPNAPPVRGPKGRSEAWYV